MDFNPSEIPPPTQRQLNKLETRRLLLQAGLELFSEQGFEQTHASQIAARAGVAVGTLYLHFGDKNGLVQELLLNAGFELHNRVLQVYENPPGSPPGDPQTLARGHIEAMVSYIEQNFPAARFLLNFALRRTPVGAEVIDRMVAVVEDSLRTGAAHGLYRSDIDLALAARAEANMNLGLLAWWTEDPSRATREQIIDTLTRFRASGLHTLPR